MMKNNAATPFPMGDPVDEFTSQIMKIVISQPKRMLQTVYGKNLGSKKNKTVTIIEAPQ